MLGKKQITLRELYDNLGLLVDKFGDYPVVSEGCDCDGEVGGISIEGDSVYLHRVDDRKPIDEAEAARARDVEDEKTKKRAVEFEAWRKRILDADEEVRNLHREGGLTLDPL